MDQGAQPQAVSTLKELERDYETRDWLSGLLFRFVAANPGAANRSGFLNTAGLSWQWIGSIPWGDDAQTIASQILQGTLALGEPLGGRPGYTALGAVLAELVHRHQIGTEGTRRIAAVIVRYNLINLRVATIPAELRPFLQTMPVPLSWWREEAGVRPASGFLNEYLDYKWLLKAARACQAVCRITIPLQDATIPTLFGTGFLIAPDLVLTNYHVIMPALSGGAEFRHPNGQVEHVQSDPATITLQFGFWQESDMGVPEQGQIYYLAADDWLAQHSPNQANGLDYAVLRVHGTPGSDGVKGESRGWLTKRRQVQKGAALIIVQHPILPDMDASAPLKIVMDASTVTTVSDTRIQYLVNTEPGASGSPCFNKDWELVALHHAGLKNLYNEGIPIQAIYNEVALLIT